jgi:hypothetical protein
MKKSFTPVTIISIVALVLAAVLFAMNSQSFTAKANDEKVIHVVERATTDTPVNIGTNTGDALGNQLVFHNFVYDAADKAQVGSDNGNCVRTVVGKVWECYWTILLRGGQMTVEGPFYDDGTDSMLAITGGTGIYKDARGQMKLHARNPAGTEYDFIYYISK